MSPRRKRALRFSITTFTSITALQRKIRAAQGESGSPPRRLIRALRGEYREVSRHHSSLTTMSLCIPSLFIATLITMPQAQSFGLAVMPSHQEILRRAARRVAALRCGRSTAPIPTAPIRTATALPTAGKHISLRVNRSISPKTRARTRERGLTIIGFAIARALLALRFMPILQRVALLAPRNMQA